LIRPFPLPGPAITPLKIALAMENLDVSKIRLNRIDDLVDMTGENQFSHGQPEPNDHSGFDMRGQRNCIWIGHNVNQRRSRMLKCLL
jgi:hypothetical protein